MNMYENAANNLLRTGHVHWRGTLPVWVSVPQEAVSLLLLRTVTSLLAYGLEHI